MTGAAVGGFASLVGQEAAVRALRSAAANPVHAYLLVGPPGSGKLAAALGFAELLLCPNGGEDGCSTCQRVGRGVHPDLIVLDREGPAITIDQAREVTRLAVMGPVEGARKVIVIPDLHLAREAGPALLKTIEEPPASTVFVALAEFVPPELVTIASRCSMVELRPLPDEEISAALVSDGVPEDRARLLAELAQGRLDRARLLANDPEALARQEAWASVPARLDGTGYTAAVVARQLLSLLERSAAPLLERQEAELSELASQQAAAVSVPGRHTKSRFSGRGKTKDLEDRHRREQRRQRVDELRAGLGVLARAYRDRAASGALAPGQAAGAVALVDKLSADLVYNPGELLALEALLVRLGRLG
ncbi:MAG: ATP-binding protein [Acidimicrobiales bacterium]